MKRLLHHIPEVVVILGFSLFAYAIAWTVLESKHADRKVECREAARFYARHCDRSPEVCDSRIKAVYEICMED